MSEKDRRYLNEIYAAACKKYFAGATDFIESNARERYDERVKEIMARAGARKRHAAVLKQLDRAMTDFYRELCDQDKERSRQLSRSYRDLQAFLRVRLVSPVAAQTLVDEEVYAAYVQFLLKFPPGVAFEYVNNERLFKLNLSPSFFTRLYAEMQRRV